MDRSARNVDDQSWLALVSVLVSEVPHFIWAPRMKREEARPFLDSNHFANPAASSRPVNASGSTGTKVSPR